MPKEFVNDFRKFRDRATRHAREGPVTACHGADRAKLVALLDPALATEEEHAADPVWLLEEYGERN